MKKTYRLDEIDCAACAAKLERSIGKISGVDHVSINFLTQKMILEADDGIYDQVFEQVKKLIAKKEPDCKVL